MLAVLPQLHGAKLSAFRGTEDGWDYPDTENHEWVQLPAMSGIAALTALEVVGASNLTPYLRQLSALQRLHMMISPVMFEEGDPPFQWGTAPLTALAALTHIELYLDSLPGEGREEWGYSVGVADRQR